MDSRRGGRLGGGVWEEEVWSRGWRGVRARLKPLGTEGGLAEALSLKHSCFGALSERGFIRILGSPALTLVFSAHLSLASCF